MVSADASGQLRTPAVGQHILPAGPVLGIAGGDGCTAGCHFPQFRHLWQLPTAPSDGQGWQTMMRMLDAINEGERYGVGHLGR